MTLSGALTPAELERVKDLSNSCARHFYRFTGLGQFNQVVLFALFKVTLGYSNADAQKLMDETMAERERQGAEGRTVDPLVVALVKISRIKCLQNRTLDDDDVERLYRECEAVAQQARCSASPKAG